MSARDAFAAALVDLLTRDGWTHYRNSPAAAESVVRGEWMPHLTPLLDAVEADALEDAAEQLAWTTEHDNEVVSARDLYENVARLRGELEPVTFDFPPDTLTTPTSEGQQP